MYVTKNENLFSYFVILLDITDPHHAQVRAAQEEKHIL